MDADHLDADRMQPKKKYNFCSGAGLAGRITPPIPQKASRNLLA